MRYIKHYAEAIDFLKQAGTKAAVAMGCEGFMVYVVKSDLIAQLSRLDADSKASGYSLLFSNYDGSTDVEGSVYIENNVLHFDNSIVIPQG